MKMEGTHIFIEYTWRIAYNQRPHIRSDYVSQFTKKDQGTTCDVRQSVWLQPTCIVKRSFSLLSSSPAIRSIYTILGSRNCCGISKRFPSLGKASACGSKFRCLRQRIIGKSLGSWHKMLRKTKKTGETVCTHYTWRTICVKHEDALH